jgi:uncharacterized protein
VNAEEFEWDATKAETNVAKHGVSFQAATAVFQDLFAWDRSDSAHESGELRYVITGIAGDGFLTVVYTERGSRIRIISARRATNHERREYYRSQTAE